MPLELKSSETRSLLDHFAKRQSEILTLTRLLVEIESPSGDLEGSRAAVSLLVKAAQTIEGVMSIERIVSSEYGEHLRIRAFAQGGTAQGTTLLLGHTDTVHARGSIEQRPWRMEGGRIYGPGIFDMKANCALALETLSACATLGLKLSREVVLLLTCDEETGSLTGRALVEEESRRASHVLVLEPPAPGGRVKTARKGTGMFKLSIEGRAAHAGLEPEKGASAILEMAKQIERLHELNDQSKGTTVNVGVISGGTRSNVVAAEAHAEIDVRFSTNAEATRLEEVFTNLRPFDERVRLNMRGGINRPPFERTKEVVNLYERARSLADQFDYELGETSVGGASDGNFAASLCPSVLDGLGIDGDGAHADHEHIVINDIARRGALLAGLIASL